jgi:hypothetical protein
MRYNQLDLIVAETVKKQLCHISCMLHRPRSLHTTHNKYNAKNSLYLKELIPSSMHYFPNRKLILNKDRSSTFRNKTNWFTYFMISCKNASFSRHVSTKTHFANSIHNLYIFPTIYFHFNLCILHCIRQKLLANTSHINRQIQDALNLSWRQELVHPIHICNWI